MQLMVLLMVVWRCVSGAGDGTVRAISAGFHWEDVDMSAYRGSNGFAYHSVYLPSTKIRRSACRQDGGDVSDWNQSKVTSR